MYEQHFGLQKHPFTARASGADVFVGPQTAATMAGMKKALQSQDAVIVVSGPAGAGKSTLVGKALDAVAGTHRSVRIGRMSLDGSDALEFLLEELGVTELPRGTIRQFAAFREKLGQLQSEGTRLVIVIEDAIVTGIDTLAEFEALTAADAGASGGAAIIVMGDQRLATVLEDPQLARLAQRVRQRQAVSPLSPAELRGYLVHCFRKAGKEFHEIFDPDAAVVIHDLCDGNPRITNNLVDAVLAAAAASNLSPVTGKFIADVGSNQLGLVASNPAAADPAPAPEPIKEPVLEPVLEPAPEQAEAPVGESASKAQPKPEPEPEREPKPEPERETAEAPAIEPDVEEQPDPVIVFSDEPPGDLLHDEDIPDLIQDTLPDLEVLAPELMEPEPSPESAPEFVAESRPEPAVEQEPAEQTPAAGKDTAVPTPVPIAAADDVPEWERDPTMAELKPDLDALEKAMAFAHGNDDAGEPPVLEPLAEPAPEEPDSTPPAADLEEIPEITLDNAIQERIDNSRKSSPDTVNAALEGAPSAEPGDLPDVQIPSNDARKADQEIERIAAELAKAKTIEDVDDKLAETLFGEEFSLIAAQVAASLPTDTSANDSELITDEPEAAAESPAPAAPVSEDEVPEGPALEVSLETPVNKPGGGLDLSASQRLRTVRALNADKPTSRPAANGESDTAPETAARTDGPPDSIEDQINTSMTQTLRALNVRPPTLDQDADDSSDDDKGEKTGGFFSRFRRS